MDNRKGKSKSKDDEVRKIDLTLKLGPSSVHYNHNEGGDDTPSREVHGFSNAVFQPSNGTGNCYVEYGSPYWRNGGGSTNYMIYQGGFPSYHSSVTTSDRKRTADDGKACKACGSSSTPLWRKGPDGPQTLCNACGLRHLRTVKKGGE